MLSLKVLFEQRIYHENVVNKKWLTLRKLSFVIKFQSFFENKFPVKWQK